MSAIGYQPSAVSKNTAKGRLRGVNYNPKRTRGTHGFTLHSFRHTFVTDMLRAFVARAVTPDVVSEPAMAHCE